MTDILKNYAVYVPFPVIACVLALLLTRLAITVLPKIGLVDMPRGRHQHEAPVPVGGGIAIWTAFLASAGLMLLSPGQGEVRTFFAEFSIPALLILITGLIDDRYELRSTVKLLVQIGIGVLLYWMDCGIIRLLGHELPVWLGLPVTVIWCVVIINAFNLIDGLDGIAAGLASISSFLLAVWTLISGSDSVVTMALLLCFCGSCLGFLRYNFSPAKIFMGDTGSMFIGLVFAYFSMNYSVKSVTFAALLVPLMAVGVPIFDVMLAVWRRFFRRYIRKDRNSSIMQGDHDHLHHRILKETGQQRKTAYIIYGIAGVLSLLTIAGVFLYSKMPGLIFFVILIAFFTLIRYATIEVFDTIDTVTRGLKTPHRNFIVTAIHPVLDSICVLIAFLVCRKFYHSFLPNADMGWWILSFVAPFTICLCCSGVYRTFWLRAGIWRYHLLLRYLLAAGGVCLVLNILICKYYLHAESGGLYGFFLVFLLLTLFLISAERFVLRYYESFAFRQLYVKNQEKTETERILIYGGGLTCRLFLSCLYCNTANAPRNVQITGIMDDNPALRRLNVYGFYVLGGLEQLEQIYEQKPFDEIMITLKNTSPEQMANLREFSRTHNIRLKQFVCGETDAAI